MKPRLEPVDHTEHDAFVWAHVVLEAPGPVRFGSTLWTRSLMQDRHDADRMLRIMQLGCRFCGSNSMHGEVHERDCIYVTDPSTRRVWIRKGARIIE